MRIKIVVNLPLIQSLRVRVGHVLLSVVRWTEWANRIMSQVSTFFNEPGNYREVGGDNFRQTGINYTPG